MAAGARTVDDKRRLRAELLAARRALPGPTVAAASRAIVAGLRVLPELTAERPGPRRAARNVLLYAADADEVDLDPLLLVPPSPWRVLLPRVVDGGIVAVPHLPGRPLAVGYRGIREPDGGPDGDPDSGAVDPVPIDAVIVPGVAFGPDGTRLGRGAGMYDRLLARLPEAVRIGVCLEAFIRTDLPVEPHDVVMDVVVTDASVRRRADARGPRPA